MKKSNLLGAVCACFFVQSAHAVPIVFGTNAYEFISGGISWGSAKTAAEALTFNSVQGHLATIFTSAENSFVANIISDEGVQQAWIGGSDSLVEGEWRWVTGELFWLGGIGGSVQNGLYANWLPSQPDGEDYLVIFSDVVLANNEQWNDAPGGSPNPGGFIVEYDNASVVPIPAALWLFGSGLLGLIGAAKKRKAT